METPSERKPERDSAQAAVHISNSHQILKALEEKIGKHPEIDEIRDGAEYSVGKDWRDAVAAKMAIDASRRPGLSAGKLVNRMRVPYPPSQTGIGNFRLPRLWKQGQPTI